MPRLSNIYPTSLRALLQRTIPGKAVAVVCLSAFLSACSTHTNVGENYFLAETSIALLFAYSGETFVPSPEFRVFKLQTPLTAFTDFSYPVRLSAFSDSSCKTAAPGTLTVGTNPLPFTDGIASFPNVSYALANGAEGLIYLSGSIANDNFSSCGLSHSIIQHFNTGTGSIHFGAPGAAGSATAASVADQAIAQQITSAGAYIVAGTTRNPDGGTEMALWRYLPTGALDTTFNTVGYVSSGSPGVAGAPSATELDIPVDLQIDSSGRYVVLGTSKNTTGTELALWRYNSNGSIDTNFGSSGRYHTDSPGLTGRVPASAVLDLPKAMVIDSSGNIIVTGTSKNVTGGSELFVARFTSLGVLDGSFGSGGIYHFGSTGTAGATSTSENDIGYGIKIAANRGYVIAGTSAYSGGGTELALWKVLSSGLGLDSNFGTSGKVLYGTTGLASGTGINLSDIGRSVQIDSSGSIVISGSSQNSLGGIEMAMWRYLSNGSPDTSFAGSGALHFGPTGLAGATGASENDVGRSFAIDPRYKFYIIAGSSVNASGGTQVGLWRYTFTGTLDPTFNLAGTAVTLPVGTAGGKTPSTVFDTANSLKLDAYGTYIIVGSTLNGSGGTELAIWRYLIIGIPDI
ncbi:MAG: hypothetical protein ABIQ95_09660 [Bdellovibrionia bacterium]